ncbi:MAG: FtsW/RodA/SpoVE family cell cycle protein, partial [Firmicutes bacterium]|nr:FtsW/RodA/SpoVE family cell cycle protein [Bacillota bacterium]
MGRRSPDYAVIGTVLTLLAVGLLMVWSSSSVRALGDYGDAYYYVKRQALWALLGLGAMGVMMRVDYELVRRYARVFFLFALIAVVLVLIPGIGLVAGGARRWLGYGPLRFQPSELMKLAMVVYVAWALSRQPGKVRDFTRGVLPYVLLLGLVFFLILKQPDLGTAVTLSGT